MHFITSMNKRLVVFLSRFILNKVGKIGTLQRELKNSFLNEEENILKRRKFCFDFIEILPEINLLQTDKN